MNVTDPVISCLKGWQRKKSNERPAEKKTAGVGERQK